MTKRRTQAVGHGHDASPNLASRGNNSGHPIGGSPDLTRFGVRAELDLRMVADRVGQACVEGEPPDPKPRLLAVVLGEGHRRRWPLGKPELDSAEWRRTARD